MNKVFKVIWNHATQTWTAVSELGHAKGKTKSKKIVKLTALAGAVLSVVGTAQAAVEVSSSSITIKSDDPAADHATKGIDNVNIGTGANTFRDDGNNVVSHDAIAIGTNATGTGDKAVAIGKNASATKENGIAIGFDATNQSIDSVAIGREATSSKDMDVAIGKKAAASGGESLAFGSESKASGQATVAVGKNSNASGSSAVAAGYDTTAAGDNAVAVGNKATASQVNDIAVGLRASATGGRSIATGTAANASGAYSIATGFTAAASGTESIAVGSKSSATKQDSTAIGVAATSTGNFALAMGSGANSAGHGSISTGFNSKATESGAIATGTQANASKVGSVAIGSNAQAKHDNSVALGTGSVTDDKHPFANLKIAGQNYDFAGTKLDGVVSIGTKDKERQIQNVGAGRISKTSTDAINGSQLYAVADAVSNHHWVVGGNTTAQNTGAPQVSNHSNVTNKDIVEFQNGNGTKATIEYTEASQSSGTPAKTVVKYHANIVNGDNTEVVTNADGSIKINAKAGKDTTAAVTTKTPDALKVTSKTENNVTTYNVDAQTGSISTTDAGSATFKENGDAATGGNFGSRLTNVSTVTDIVNNVSWHLNSSAVPGSGGKITDGSDTKAADVKASNTVNINAGKNIEIKRNGTTIEISSTAAGEKGEKGDKGEDGKNAQAKVEKQPDGSHLITIVDGDGNTTTTIVKDGATGAAGAKGEKGDTGATGAKGEKGDTGAAGAKGDTGAKGEKGDKGDKGDTGEKGGSITGEVVDNGDGTHTITITDLETGSVTTTIVKDGKDGVDGKNAKADVKDNGNGTHTVTITDGEGNTTTTIVKDGKNAEAEVKDNKDGTHTVTIKDGNGNTTTTIVKDGAKGEKGDKGDKGEDGVMTWDIKSTGNTTPDSQTDAKTIEHKNTVEMVAGKNLTVNQTNNSDGAKVEFALNSTVTNLDKVVVNGPKGKDGEDGKDGVTITAPVKAEDGKPGKDGSDGKVGISGKDGKDAVSISGKDGVGQIGLTGPKGKDGKDGASINITTDNGKQTLVNLEKGAKGEKGETTQRIVYKPVDKDGNPIKNNDGNDIVREVATMDDGLIFGGNTEDTHKAALGTQVNVKGATTNTDWNKFDAGKNIMTKVEGNTITVGLAKDLEVNSVNVTTNVTAGNVTANGTISAPTIKAGDTTIQNGKVTNLKHHIENPTTVVDDKVLNVSEDVKKEAATVRDVLNSGWNLQANGKPVDAVTHGNTVNFANGKGITVTAEPNKDGTTSKVSFDVNVDNDTITVNDKGQLVSNGSTNFNVATKDGGNKVAKKGGSSTTKITSGKTITYTAGKNIAIEQNGGDILVSTTDDVNHNSVTTKDLTVNKGGNIDMGGNQVHNVKAGTKDTDAVNVSQLKQSIGDVHKRINKVGKEARGGIAGANAAAGLPQVYIPGKSMVAASAGTFKGESAVAVGYSRSSDNGKVIFKLQGNANTQGDVGGSVGVGYQW